MGALDDYLKQNYGNESEKAGNKRRKKKRSDGGNFAVIDDDVVIEYGRKTREAGSAARGGRSKTRGDVDWGGDASPPHRSVGDSDDASPPRRRAGAAEDASPPRRRAGAAEDASPPRQRAAAAEDASPPRRRAAAGEDASPPRRRPATGEDASPPRRRPTNNDDASPPRRRPKMSSGLSAGLLLKDDVAAEAKRVRLEREATLQSMTAEQSGRGAENTFRNEQGRKIVQPEVPERLDAEPEVRTVLIDGEERQIGPDGLASTMDGDPVIVGDPEGDDASQGSTEAKRAPADDRWGASQTSRPDVRWGDPMANLLKVPVSNSQSKFRAPPNRFNILPGPRWDGEDRSNGYETKFIEAEGVRKDRESKAYKWSVEGM